MSTPSPYEHFSMEELSCPCCGQMKMDPGFMNHMVKLRKHADFKFPVTSAYRCPDYDKKVSKSGSGAHTTGKAMDLGLSRGQAMHLIRLSAGYPFTGLGVNQKGERRFLHLDSISKLDISPRTNRNFLRPTVWSY